MDVPKKHAANCKWARPTVEEPAPVWLDAERRPWTCEQDGTPRPLESTEICEDCPYWTPDKAENA